MTYPRRILAHWTAARHAWLRRVARGVDTASRPRGCTGFDCMQLGWTEWKRSRAGHVIGEQLTREGRRILRRWDRRLGVDTPQSLR